VQPGDVIVSINGTAIANNLGVSRVLQTISPGTTVKVIVERGRSQVVAFVTTVARPPGT
jgi:S1-C subfamily serine protease